MWESLLALVFLFLFCGNPLCMDLGLGTVIVSSSHPLRGINYSNLMLSLEGDTKLTHLTLLKGKAPHISL
jgi:hypothetical protein